MKRILMASVFAAGAALGALSIAQAGTISLGLQESGVNGGAITTVGTASLTGSASFGGSYGTFTLNTLGAQGTPAPGGDFASSSINTSSSTPGTLTIYATETGLTGPLGAYNMLSGLTENFLSGAIQMVGEATYADTGNGAYALTTQLASDSFTGTGTFDKVTTTPDFTGPYSLTEVYTVVATNTGTANSTILMTDVPEPGSLLLLGTGLLGLGLVVRRRHKSKV